jgi:hypothetical protein
MSIELPEPATQRSNMVDEHHPAVRHRNMVLGLWLFAIALILLAGTVAVAFIYLAAD